MRSQKYTSSGRSSELVILVHGFFRTSRDMRFLASGLQKAGYDVLCPHLPATLGTMEDCRRILSSRAKHEAVGYEKVHLAGHSLGGLVLFQLLKKEHIPALGSCIFIATPFQGTRLADILAQIPLARRIFRSIPALRTRTGLKPVPPPRAIYVGVISGTRNSLLLGKIFLSTKSDGRVEVDSTKLPEATDCLDLPFGHEDIHHQPQTLRQVLFFLRHGRFFHHQRRTPEDPHAINAQTHNAKTRNTSP